MGGRGRTGFRVAFLRAGATASAQAPESSPSPASTSIEPMAARTCTPSPDVAVAVASSEADPFAMRIHGFVSPGFIASTHGNNFLAKTADRGSFEFAEMGINFTKPLAENLRAGMQLFTRKLGARGH